MLLSSLTSSSRSAVSLYSLHQFLCKVLRYTLTICATVAALSLHSRPKQAALASSLPLITLFSCVYCFFAQRRRHRSLLLTCPVQLTGALLFLHLHSLTLPPAPPHPTPSYAPLRYAQTSLALLQFIMQQRTPNADRVAQAEAARLTMSF